MTEQNWSKTHAFRAKRLHRPETIDALCALVADCDHIHAVGARHSFNGVADSPGDLVDLEGIAPGFSIDGQARTVTFTAGVRYRALVRHLEAQGFALANLASLAHLCVAGAVATGTHGSGDKIGSLATAVSGLEFVSPDGRLIRARRGDADYEGMVVALGALGIVARLTLDIEPSYEVRVDAFVDLPWPTQLSEFDAVMGLGDSVSLMTSWSTPAVGNAWIKTRLDSGAPRHAEALRLGAKPAPEKNPSISDDIAKDLNPFGVPGPWSERLPHFRLDSTIGPIDQIQSEYLLPRGAASAAIASLRAIGERIDGVLIISEIRTVRRDTLWLSPSFGHDCVALHFTWRKEPAAVEAICRAIEDIVIPLGGRPHWGKATFAGAERLAPLYPRFEDFRRLAARFDPKGKFRNAFLDAHVFG